MFANQLIECANDESSFRFVIRDLNTKSPVLQIILLNPDTWSCSGSCSDTQDEDPVPKLQLRPIIKVLFSDCSTATESQLRSVIRLTFYIMINVLIGKFRIICKDNSFLCLVGKDLVVIDLLLFYVKMFIV